MQKNDRPTGSLIPIVKWCRKHGNLTAKDVIKSGKHNKTRCRECYKEVRKNNYLKHKDAIREKTKRWKEANPERLRELNRESRKRRSGIVESVEQFPTRDRKFHRARIRLRNVLITINRMMRDVNKID